MSAPNLGRILQPEDWPDQDQELWQVGVRGGDLLEGRNYARDLRSTTLCNSRKGYGRWLSIVSETDPSALQLNPADRVTPARARVFLEALQACGNSNNTIQARFWELRSSLRIMCPRQDFQWLNKPGGTYLSALLPITLRTRQVVDARELAQWGEDLMLKGLTHSAGRNIEWFRNGLLIATFATRAPRQRSMARLQLGRNIVRRDSRFQISFHADDMKSGRPLEYFLPDWLTPYVDHYLDAVRPRLLDSKTHDWFWVGRGGHRLAEIGMQAVIQRAANRRLGFVIRAHTFRHSYATTTMMLDPTSPKKVAAVLGNSPYVIHQNYDFGGQIEAATKWQNILDSYDNEED